MDPEALLDLGYRVKSGKTQVLAPRLIQSSRWRQCQAALLGDLTRLQFSKSSVSPGGTLGTDSTQSNSTTQFLKVYLFLFSVYECVACMYIKDTMCMSSAFRGQKSEGIDVLELAL